MTLASLLPEVTLKVSLVVLVWRWRIHPVSKGESGQ